MPRFDAMLKNMAQKTQRKLGEDGKTQYGKSTARNNFGHNTPKESRYQKDGVSLKTAVRYSRYDVAEQERIIEACIIQQLSLTAIQRTLRQRWPHFSMKRLATMHGAITTRWAEESRARMYTQREAAVRRAYNHLTRAMQSDNEDNEMIRFAEVHLAKILGLYAPDKLEVSDRGQQIGEAIRYMTQEQIQDLRAEYRRTVSLALKAKQAGISEDEEGLDPPDPIQKAVVGEVVPRYDARYGNRH